MILGSPGCPPQARPDSRISARWTRAPGFRRISLSNGCGRDSPAGRRFGGGSRGEGRPSVTSPRPDSQRPMFPLQFSSKSDPGAPARRSGPSRALRLAGDPGRPGSMVAWRTMASTPGIPISWGRLAGRRNQLPHAARGLGLRWSTVVYHGTAVAGLITATGDNGSESPGWRRKTDCRAG